MIDFGSSTIAEAVLLYMLHVSAHVKVYATHIDTPNHTL